MYLIRGLLPRRQLGGHGFEIELLACGPAMVAASGITQQMVDAKINQDGNEWLDSCGYDRLCSADGKRLHEARHALRVQWGTWGPEHISVPGNACGLDIDNCFGRFEGSRVLTPHNVDCQRQQLILLIVFTTLADDVAVLGEGGAG